MRFVTRWLLFSAGIIAIAGESRSDIKITKYRFDFESQSAWQILASPATDWDEALSAESWQAYNVSFEDHDEPQFYWLKSSITNHLPLQKNVFFHVVPSLIDQFQVFIVKDRKLESSFRLGMESSVRSSKVSGFSHNFSLNLPPGAKRIILIKLEKTYLNHIKIKLQDQETFKVRLSETRSFHGAIIGAIGSLLLVGFILSLARSDRLCFIFSIGSLFSIALIARALGYLGFSDPTFASWWNLWSITLFETLYIVCMARYFSFAPTLNTAHQVRSIMKFFSWLALLFLPLSLIDIHSSVTVSYLLNILGFLANLLILVSLLSKRDRAVWLFALPLVLQGGLISSSSLIRWGFADAESLEAYLYLFFLVIVNYYGALLYQSGAKRQSEPAHPTPQGAGMESSVTPDSKDAPLVLAKQASAEPDESSLFQEFRIASLGTLTNGLAHELNNPLAIIAGHQYRLSSMVRSKALNMNDIKVSLEKIGSAVKRVLSVIDALKAYSQDDFAKVEFSSHNIRETIQFALDLSRERLNSLGVHLTTQPIPDTFINCNQSQIMQCILILIDNALDAVRDQESKTIAIEFKQTVTMVEVSVIDNGPGISISHQSRIFDPFFTTKSSDQRKGLGLSIARGVVANHGGKLYLRADFPQTCFVVQLKR
ncbi:ATP-binding protein [Pseudobacteriovorax antillogorgiicola]|uniref:histidine kinase n=1 Tax=Pseudobacteriovorax antillogorgiicola TaxID=1513793 RepID=A0A1Y6BZG2_9BACT|nr:ATP-binding protein [Pseudobacteriovorax antillogorgiicola]TCS51291.1 signal transduction histidine kinase [Pseudobacteriovorax antillogorgiicola]SMF36109.1 Signal transduction histidine kinase [Pseudobacteriovorax antillogorgiicola]